MNPIQFVAVILHESTTHEATYRINLRAKKKLHAWIVSLEIVFQEREELGWRTRMKNYSMETAGHVLSN